MIGMPNPWVIVAGLVALAAAGAGGSYIGWHLRDASAEKEKVTWERAMKDEAVQAANEIDKAQKTARATEQKAAIDAANDATLYQKVIDDAHAERDRDVAAARAGAVRMRVPGGCRPVQADSGGSAAPASRGPGDHSSADAELPPEVAGDLTGLAHDADAIVDQLTAAQRRILFDLEHCGAKVTP